MKIEVENVDSGDVAVFYCPVKNLDSPSNWVDPDYCGFTPECWFPVGCDMSEKTIMLSPLSDSSKCD